MSSNSDLSILLNYRDSIYSRDLLICAIVHFNLFTYMVQKKISFDVCCKELYIQERPTCVMRSLFVSMGLLEIGDNGDYYPSDNATQYLNSESENTLIPYFALLKNRPQCLEFREVLLSDKPSGWSSKKSGQD